MNLAVWYSTCKTADIAESIRLKSYTHLTIISNRIFIVSVIVNIITAVQGKGAVYSILKRYKPQISKEVLFLILIQKLVKK